MAAQPLASLDRSTLRERSLEALRTAITSGEYRPGDHLGEEDLARRLGVSRGTVREALRYLQQEGLVTAGARGMLRVHSLSAAEIRDLFQVRAALEVLAVTLLIASPRRDAAVAKLREALSNLGYEPDEIREALAIPAHVPLVMCDARQRDSVKQVLVNVVEHAMATLVAEQSQGGYPAHVG